MIRLVAQDEFGRDFLVEVDNIGGANIVLIDVPCESLSAVGDFVRMNSSGVAVRALADTYENSNVIGLIESKSTTTICNVRVQGVSPEIFTSLDVTKEYYLSDIDPGKMSTSVPITTGHIKLKLGQPFSVSQFLMNKGERLIRG